MNELLRNLINMGKVAVFIDDVIVGTEFEEVSSVVHTRVEVRRMYSEMSGLVEQPWLQLMCCTVCLLRGRNFR